MADYTKDIQGAWNDIAEAGIMVQITRAGATIDVPLLFVAFNPSIVDGVIVMYTDRFAIIPGGLERNPDPEQDRIIVPPCDIYPDGANVQIRSARPMAPNGQAILWDLQLRK
jgi:hypothetical protein